MIDFRTEQNLDSIASDIGLTDKQKAFCEFYVFVTGLEAFPAIELAGYSVTTDSENYDENTKEVFKAKKLATLARDLLNNNKVLKYIRSLRDELDNQLIVDKLWVIKKLKSLAITGTENTQLKALELLGKSMEMFTEKTKVENADDPAKIAKEAFEKRKNTVDFKRQQNE